MAAAADVAGTAAILMSGNLAILKEAIVIDKSLQQLSEIADRATLVAIASVLLKRFPPQWIFTAVVDGEFFPELVPDTDLQVLAWLGDDRDSIILAVNRSITAEDERDIRKKLGDVGEQVVVSALRCAGYVPRHVALISDIYGYDIEYQRSGLLERVEVKTCFSNGSGEFIISKNEFLKAQLFKSSWRLVQVCLSTNVLVNNVATAESVVFIREFSSARLLSLVPPFEPTFEWLESAKIRPSESLWEPSRLKVASSFSAYLT